MRVREIVYTLTSQYDGKFGNSHDFWLDMNLLQLLTQAALESVIPERELPSSRDKFVATSPSRPAAERLKDEQLDQKWRQIQPRLNWGASAADLAGQLSYSERELRVTLHHLLSVGAITPQPKLSERRFPSGPDANPSGASFSARKAVCRSKARLQLAQFLAAADRSAALKPPST